MTIPFLLLALWLLSRLLRKMPRIQHKRRQRNNSPPPLIVTPEWCKQQERERKEAAKKAQAAWEIETAQETLNDLDLLMDAAQYRYHNSTKDKDIEKAQRQIISLRRQIAATVEKIEKAKYILQYGG